MRCSWQALKSFLKQDLRDYRLKDYDALPAKARWILLGCLSITLLLMAIMGLRIFWLDGWQERLNAEKAHLSRQITLLTLKNREYQDFLTPERIDEVRLLTAKVAPEEGLQRDILQEVMLKITEFPGAILQFSPKLEPLTHRLPSNPSKGYRAGIQRSSAEVSSELPRYNLATLWDSLQRQTEKSLPKTPFDRLNLTFELCGTSEVLYGWLNEMAHIPHYLLYIDSLQWQSHLSSKSACSETDHHYLKGTLQLYGFSQLTEFMPDLLQPLQLERGINPSLEVNQIVNAWKHREAIWGNGASHNLNLPVLIPDIASLFEERTVNFLNEEAEKEVRYLTWQVGESYGGYYLIGIFSRAEKQYAIVALERNRQHLQIVTEGMLDIRAIDLPARRIILAPSENRADVIHQ